jgi:hypothetical protein
MIKVRMLKILVPKDKYIVPNEYDEPTRSKWVTKRQLKLKRIKLITLL